MAPKIRSTVTCPNCGAKGTATLKSRVFADGVRRRYRKCRECHERFKTLEAPGKPEKVVPMTDNGNSKLTEDEVRDIRRMLKNGWSKVDLSIQYDVGTQAIYYIEKRKTWSNLK